MKSFKVVKSRDDLPAIATGIVSSPFIGLDIETSNLDRTGGALEPREGLIRLVQLNLPGWDAIQVLDLFALDDLGPVARALDETRGVVVGHNCLTGDQRVLKADGTRRPLKDMVRDRDEGPVVTINETTGALESRKVVGWVHGDTRAWADWLSVRFEGKGRLRLTKDHQVLTTRGRVAAELLRPGDQILTPEPGLSDQQQALIYGTLMGDASITMSSVAKARSPHLQFSHCREQADYARWKYDLLGDLQKRWSEDSKPTFRGLSAKDGTWLVRAFTKSDHRLLPIFHFVRPAGGPKTLTPAWIAVLSPAAIAVWLADNGSWNGSGVGIRACVSAFVGRGLDLLVDWMLTRGWPVTTKRRKDGQTYLTIAGPRRKGVSDKMHRFWSEVAPFFPECMEYKVPPRYRPLVGTGWTTLPSLRKPATRTVRAVEPLVRTKGRKGRYEGQKPAGVGPRQYCLTVEGNANFVAEGNFVSNCKFEQKWFLYHYGVEFKRLFCTFRASKWIHNGHENLDHDLYAIYKRELNIDPPTGDFAGSNWGASDLSEEQIQYAASDVEHLFALREVLVKRLIEDGLVKIAQIEFQAILPECAMELNGLYFDQARWNDLALLNRSRLQATEAHLRSVLPSPHKQLALLGFDPSKKNTFNLGSPDQMLQSLRMLGIKQELRDPKTGKKSVVEIQDTLEITLAMLTAQNPVIEKIIEHRGYSQRDKNFSEAFLADLINSRTGRCHTNYWPFTGAGRYSCSPNFQQIPREKAYRECIRPQAGRKLSLADYSAIELVIVAELSRDPRLIEVFNTGVDPHKTTAALMAGVTLDKVTKQMRQQAKPVNFGFCYGMSAPKLVLYAKAGYGVTLSEQEAQNFRKKYFEAYKGVEKWHAKNLRDGARLRQMRTIWGRRRWLDPEIAHNEFHNGPSQGTGADGLKNSLPIVYQRLKKITGGPTLLEKGASVGMIHMVHDEIIAEHKDDEDLAAEVRHAIESGMIDGMQPMLSKVPSKAEASTCSSWAEKG